MRKIILDLAVTLDGFIEGPNKEIDWCILDDDMGFDEFLSGIDTIFYGRVSYDLWGNYQPEEKATPAEKEVWKAVHSKNKVVFTTSHREDNRARFVADNIAESVADIKKQAGKNIWLYGGAGLIKTFIDLELVDVYRLSVHPVALGSGKPLFGNLKDRLTLKLVETKRFRSGVVQLLYEK